MELVELFKNFNTIESLTGEKCVERKKRLFDQLIDDSNGTVLKLFDKYAKYKTCVSTQTIKHMDQQAYNNVSFSVQDFVNTNIKIQNIKGPNSTSEKKTILREVYQKVSPEYRVYLNRYYAYNSFKIGFDVLSIYNHLKHRYGLDATKTTELESNREDFLYRTYCLAERMTVEDDTAVYTCKPMLAAFKKLQSISNLHEYDVEFKLDGIRLFIRKDLSGAYTSWTRSGLHINCESLFKVLDRKVVNALKRIEPDYVLDGELWAPNVTAGQGFRSLLPIVKTKDVSKIYDRNKTHHVRFLYSAFDVIHLRTDLRNMSYRCRKQALLALRIPYTLKHVKAGTKQSLERLIHRTKASNYQGVILKRRLSTYESRRSLNWLKLKPDLDTIDVQVTSFKKGTGKYEHLYSSFGVSVLNGSELTYIGDVGSGFSEQDLTLINDKIRTYGVNFIIEVRSEALSRSKKNTYGLRFPRFIRLRPDKTEPNTLDEVKRILMH